VALCQFLRAEVQARLARYERHILRDLGEENPDPEGSGVFHQQLVRTVLYIVNWVVQS
jgi:hypothetical protein